MNVWFGDSWGAPVNEILEQVPTPIGATCPHCEEPILQGEDGWGESRHGKFFHRECWTRMTLGSVAHQMQVCSCHGGPGEDNPKMSVRENARAALDYALQVRDVARALRQE